MNRDQAIIDDRPVDVMPGETILTAACRLGIEIPTLCHVDGLVPDGGCRLCLVEIDRPDNVQAACHTTLEPGMSIRTATSQLDDLRREILTLVRAQPGLHPFREDPAGCVFERLLARYDGRPAAPRDVPATQIDESHPYLRFDRSRCITCRQCLAVCEQVQGQFVYGVAERGADRRLVFGPNDRFADSPCTACGACVDVCPTYAITDRDRITWTPPDRVTESVCGYCGVGCRVAIETTPDRVLRISGVKDAAVNRGHLCAKGRYAHAWHHSPDRLTQPLRREGTELKPISWDEAIAWVAERLLGIRDEHGPDAAAVMTSSRSTNEAAYLLQKLFRTRIGTNNVDCCARVCHSSTALALQLSTGTGAASASYDDIERAACIVVAGANPTEAHPVVGARIKQAVLRGATLIVIDPRRIELAEYADVHLPLTPGTNVALFNALARVLIDEALVDRSFIADRTEGFEALSDFLAKTSAAEDEWTTGIDATGIANAARLIAAADTTLFVSGLGLSETTQGTASVMTFCNLAMLTGNIGAPGTGMLPLRGQNNVQGNADMGGMPNMVTGYQSVTDPTVRDHVGRLWGAPLPERPGLTIHEMLEAARTRSIRALWIQGEDVAQSDPHQTHVIEALESVDLLVVQELFMSETARYAHLVLPAQGVLEQEGTFTNGERRIQHVCPAVPAPGDARPDWAVARDVANAMGETWTYAGPSDVMDEIALVAPRLFGGVSFTRLDPDGLQWPCPTVDHPGTHTVHADGFLCGRGRIVTVDYVPSPEHDVEGYPFMLITGRVLHHYNVGTMTRRTPSRELTPEDLLEIHPQDAEAEGIADGAEVVVESRWGTTTARVRHRRRVMPGTLFMSFHYPETHTNRLVGPSLDPQSKCPQYKVTAVRLKSERRRRRPVRW